MLSNGGSKKLASEALPGDKTEVIVVTIDVGQSPPTPATRL